jgi:hypothetical protein
MRCDPVQLETKANFFLVGAPKAGTTSVDRVLRGHPDVFLSPIKEPCHFCPDVNTQIAALLKRKDRVDLSTYLASSTREFVHLCHVPSAADYARLFEGAGGRAVIGECSSYYLSSSSAPGAIHAYNPDAKILVLLRNPLDRIRSHYAMDLSLGLASQPLPSLVEEELALGDDANWGNCRYYVGASRYARQLEAYYRYFPPEQVCVLSFEQLVGDTDAALRRLFSFLQIAVPDGPLVLPRANRSRATRFPLLHNGLRVSGLKPVLSHLLKRRLRGRIEQAAKSIYYRERAQVVSDKDLRTVGMLLREEGLDTPVARAA